MDVASSQNPSLVSDHCPLTTYIDLHCHILPNVDDGPQSIDDALDMARFCLADGITHIAVLQLPVPTNVEQKVEERQATLTPPAQRMLAQTLDRYAASVTSREDAAVFTLR